jgi:hypothetical protein
MVADVIELCGSVDFCICVRADAVGWCQIELKTDGKVFALGADTKRVVTARLLSAISDSLTSKPSGQIRGLAVHWIMSLAERHCSIYAADVETDRQLFFQGADGELLAVVVLSAQMRKEWLHELQRWSC